MFIWIQPPLCLLPKKKGRETTRPFTTGLFMLRCKELGLSVYELETMEFGLVADMLIEKDNDQHQYPYKASQSDYDRFAKV
jgi:hypothetical protein